MTSDGYQARQLSSLIVRLVTRKPTEQMSRVTMVSPTRDVIKGRIFFFVPEKQSAQAGPNSWAAYTCPSMPGSAGPHETSERLIRTKRGMNTLRPGEFHDYSYAVCDGLLPRVPFCCNETLVLL